MKQTSKLFISSIILTLSVYAHSNEKDTLSITTKTSSKVLVVIYSYTGNTRVVADEIIKKFNADKVVIKAKKYDTFAGSASANIDTWTQLSDFKGKNVILFNTFNSKFKQEYIEEFSYKKWWKISKTHLCQAWAMV